MEFILQGRVFFFLWIWGLGSSQGWMLPRVGHCEREEQWLHHSRRCRGGDWDARLGVSLEYGCTALGASVSPLVLQGP